MLLSGSPFPLFVESGEVMEGSCYFGEVFDELVVKIAKANELSDSFDIMGRLPVLNGFHFDTFHFKSIGR